MTHHEIAQQDIIERYVRHQLPAAERRAFQEHYFACDECFANVQSTAQFIAGVQHSARVGTLAETARAVESNAAAAPWWANWFRPAFALGAAACILLAVTLGWIVFKQILPGQEQIAQASPTPEPIRTTTPSLPPTSPTPDKSSTIEPEKTPSKSVPSPTPTPPRPSPEPKASGPVISLESSRGANTSFKVPAEATAVKLLLEVEAGGRYTSYQIQILSASGAVVKTLSGLKASASGTLIAHVTTQQMPPGKYVVKLFGVMGQQKELVGDYALTLRQ